ncbi:hypothetical protein [Deinococcus sp.]|uniref:hypothetical protein n=1 Tax=Deinococcus sp. TaxID=47478 RepID=UPI003C7C7F1C
MNPKRLTCVVALFGSLLGSLAEAVPVSLHTLLERSGGVGIPARILVADRTYDLSADGLLLDLPAGRYPVTLLTSGGRLVPDIGSDQTMLTVVAPVTERNLIIETQTALKLTLPANKTVAAGQPFVAEMTVQNTYGQPLTLTPLLQLPDGILALNDTRRLLTLAPGEAGTLQVSLLAASAGDYTLSGGLSESSGLSQASLKVAAPGVALGQPVASSATVRLSADPADPLPGDVVSFTLTLRNPGTTPLSVRATPTLPDWIVPETLLSTQTLSLPTSSGGTAGEASLHFSGRATFGPPRSDPVTVSLEGLPGTLSAKTDVQRQLLSLQVAQPEDGTVGERGSVQVLVQNPTARPVQVTLKGSGAGAALESTPVSLEARGSAVAELPLTPTQAGRQSFTVAALSVLPDGTSLPISLPASNRVRASAALNERRVSTLSQPFSLRGVPGLNDLGSNATLLASQGLPEGVSYVGGSSQLNGKTIPDPRLGGSGRLYWPLGRTSADGVLSYQVTSSDSLPTLEPLALTASVGGQDIFLSGEVPSSELDLARGVVSSEREGLIRLPRQGTVLRGQDKVSVVLEGPVGVPVTLLVNGQPVSDSLLGEETVTLGRRRLSYAGVQLRAGKNILETQYGDLSDRLEVTVAVAPVRLLVDSSGAVADGASPVVLRILALDTSGVTSGDGTITVGTDLEPITPDANPREAGYQVLMQGGVAVLRLEPLLSARRLTVSAALGSLSISQEVFVDVQTRERYAYQASFGVSFSGGNVSLDAAARGYAELPLYGGQLQLAADSDGLPRFLGTSGLNGAQNVNDLSRFPVTGSGTEAKGALSSDLGIAFRYERRDLSLGYYNSGIDLSPLPPLPSISALRAEVRESGGVDFSVRAFVGQLPSGSVNESFIPDGRRSFTLSQLARPGSALVTVVAGGLSRPLIAGRDYLLDDATGTLVLASPLSRYSSDFVPQTLVVLYTPASATATILTYGGSATYSTGPWSVSVAAAQFGGTAPDGTTPVGFGVVYGTQIAYHSPALQAALGYNVTAFDPAGKLSLSGTYLAPDGALTGSVNLSRSDTTGLVGQAEVSARLGDFRVRLAHQSLSLSPATATTQAVTSQRTSLTAERPVLPGLTLGGSLEYVWPQATDLNSGLAGVVLGRYESGGSSTELSHSQPFSAASGIAAQTRLSGSLALTSSTFLEGRIIKTWDDLGALSGELGVRQTLGNVNYTVSYQLPGVSGESSRARFGLAAPIPINDSLSANISASLLRDLGNGVFTASGAFGARYRVTGFTAAASIEGGRDFGDTTADGSTLPSNSRLTLRGGATGSLGDQDLSLDAVYNILPTPGGQFTFSYARRTDDLAILSYTRLNTGSGVSGLTDLSVGNVLEGELQVGWQPFQHDNSSSETLRGLKLQPGVAYRFPLSDLSRTAIQGSLGVSVPVTPQLALAATGYVFYQPLSTDDQGQTTYPSYALDLKYTFSPGVRLVAGYTFAQVSALTPDARPGFHIRAELYGGSP